MGKGINRRISREARGNERKDKEGTPDGRLDRIVPSRSEANHSPSW